MRRKERELDRDSTLKVVDTCAYATVAMVKSDGSPYIVALSLIRDGEWLYFHCAKQGLKLDILRHDNRVCVSCVGHTKPIPEVFSLEYESAVISGRAVEVTDREEKIHAMAVICERYTPENMAGFEEAITKSYDRISIWKVHIDEISGKRRPPL